MLSALPSTVVHIWCVIAANPLQSAVQAIVRADAGKSANDSVNVGINFPAGPGPPDAGQMLWQGANDLLLPLLFGYALMKLIIQFRPLIIAVLSMVMIALFFLRQIGIVVITADVSVWEALYEGVESNILKFGMVKFLAFIAGIWISVLRSRRRKSPQTLLVR